MREGSYRDATGGCRGPVFDLVGFPVRHRGEFRFLVDVLAFAVKLGTAFRPRQAVDAMRQKHPGVKFPTHGAATTQVYLAIYRLVDQGKLRPIMVRQKERRNYYAYQAVK